MTRLLTFLVLMMFTLGAFAAPAPKLVQAESSDNLSQFVRSNAQHYWHFMSVQADLRPLKNYLSHEGMVAGDPHLGNFAPLPLVGAEGRRGMRFVNVDFDDAGHAPFVLDFVRYVIAVEATFPESRKRTLEEAYVKGLNGQAMPTPNSLNEITSVTVADYEQMAAEYLEKNTEGGKFKIKPGKVEEYRGPLKRASIEKVFADKQVLDLALRPKDRGGSAEGLRIWVLIEDDGRQRIMELKEYQKPGVSFYQSQPSVGEWLKRVRDVFWPDMDGSSYDLVDLDGSLFWLRPKGVSVVDIPYSSEKRKKMEFAADLAEYDANLLGLAHGRQKACERYLEEIKSDREVFHDAVEKVVQEYIQIVRRAYESQQSK